MITGLRYSRDNWFTCVDTAVLADKELSQSAKIIFAVLCMLAGFGHRSCKPDDETIPEITGISADTLRSAYQELEARGVITRNGKVIYIIGHNAPCYSEEDAL